MTGLSSRYERDRFVQEVHTDYVVWEETGRADYRYTATTTQVRARDELALSNHNREVSDLLVSVLDGSTECEGLLRGCRSLLGRRSKGKGKGKGIRARDHLLPRAPLAFHSRLKLPFPKLPFPSLSNACLAG